MLRTGTLGMALGILALGVVLAQGCRRGAPPIAEQPKPPAVAGKAVAAEEPAVAESAAAKESGSDNLKNVSSIVPAADAKTAAASEPAARPSPASDGPQRSKERIVFFAPGRPLLVDLLLSIDGRPHTEALERLVEEVLKIADGDGDGRTTWKEICACPKIKYGQYGNLPVENDNSEKQVIDRYDIARDGIADRTELPRFLTRNAGSSRPFSIRGTLDYRDLNRRAAPTWQVIDIDDDGTISAAERLAAPAALAGRDSDDDEIVLAADLNPRLQSLDPDMMMERRRRGPDAARLLGEHADWTAVLTALEQHYGGRRGLRPDSFPLWPELFTQLDQNHDGRVRRDELAVLNELPAEVVVEAEFGREGSGVGGPGSGFRAQGSGGEEKDAAEEEGESPRGLNSPRLRIVGRTSAEADENRPEPGGSAAVDRVVIALGELALAFSTNDMVASDDFAARAKEALNRLDQNKDGYLEASEIPDSLQSQLGRFEAVDDDGDGKAYPHEIEAFLAQQQAGLRAQIHARAGDSRDLLFAALDSNEDQRLDSREIETAAARLQSLDINGDDQITPDELPEIFELVLARGSLETPDTTFARTPSIAPRSDKTPRWFAAMDANQDGVISRREFLGTTDQFARLDANKSGILEPAEAADDAKPPSHD
jgi:Ca2+-binding EF-hand superfamily protein